MKKFIFLIFLMIVLSGYSAEIGKTKIAYSKNGEIHYDYIGEESSKALTTGYNDMKPSLTLANDKIVFFRVKEFASQVAFWKTAICMVNADGTGFKELTSGKYTDYNPTWSRDGNNKIIFSRYDGENQKSYIYMTGVDSKPGEEILISDPLNSEYAYSALKDGRILIVSSRSPIDGAYFLLTPAVKGKKKYDLINFKYKLEGFMDRAAINLSETGISYECEKGWKSFEYAGKRIIMADFDLKTLTISNPRFITKESKKEIITIYPCWNKSENSIIYHSNRSGKSQLYLYSIIDKTTKKISLDENSDYEFPCCEGSPK